jgi:hypothetical protein
MDISRLPYFVDREQPEVETDAQSSYAPSESDCTALVDLKQRVRELDGLLDDLEVNSTDSDDNNGHVEDDDFFDIESLDRPIESNEELSPQQVDAIDMVHSLSSLFLRQEFSPDDVCASIDVVKVHQKDDSEISRSETEEESFEETERNPPVAIKDKKDMEIAYGMIVLGVFVVISIAVMAVYVIIRMRSS